MAGECNICSKVPEGKGWHIGHWYTCGSEECIEKALALLAEDKEKGSWDEVHEWLHGLTDDQAKALVQMATKG